MALMDAYNKKRKKEEDEEKKTEVVGRQQKTQTTKTVGNTKSIPTKSESRTQSSAASSTRTNTQRNTATSQNRTSDRKNTYKDQRNNNRYSRQQEQQQTSRTRSNNYWQNQQNVSTSARQRSEDRRQAQREQKYSSNQRIIGPEDLPKANKLPSVKDYKRSQMTPEQRVADDFKNRESYQTSSVPAHVINQYAQSKGISYSEAKAEIDKAERMRNQTITNPGEINQEATAQAQSQRAEELRLANQKQQTPYESFMTNMGKTVADPVNLIPFALGKATGNDWDLIGDKAREAERQATEQHPIASAAGDMAGFLIGNKLLRGGQPGQSAGAGNVLRSSYDDVIMNGGTKAQALANGLSNAARVTGANTAKEFLKTDLPLDTLPYIMNEIIEGKSNNEVAKDALLNVGANLGFNALGDIAEAGGALLKNGKKVAAQPIEDASQQATREALHNMAQEVNNPIKPQQIPEVNPVVEQAALKNATDIPIIDEPYQNIKVGKRNTETPYDIFNDGINTSKDSPYTRFKDAELEKLAKINTPELDEAYSNLIKASEAEYVNDFNNALKTYRDVANANGITGIDNTLNRLSRYVNGQTPDIDNELLGTITGLTDNIDNELAKLDAIGVPPTKNGTDWLTEAHKATRNYEDAVFNGGDTNAAMKDLNRALGNHDTQAKKIPEYDGAFSKWKGAGTIRGDLYSVTGHIPGEKAITPEEKAMIDDWLANERDTIARPANQIPSMDDAGQVVNDAVDTGIRQADEARPVKVKNSVPNQEALPDANIPGGGISETDTLWNELSGGTPPVRNDISTVEGPKTKIRQGRTNVFERSGITEDESANIFKAEDYSYVPDTNANQLERATDILNSQSEEEAIRHFTEDFDSKRAYTPEENDAMMMLNQRLRDRARNTTDAAEKARLYAQSKKLSINAVESAGNSGASLQGWSKWADTPDHVADKGYMVMKDITDKYLKQNKNAERGMKDVAIKIQKLMEEKGYKDIINSGDDMQIAKFKTELSDAIDDILSKADKNTRKALEGLTESEIDDLIYQNSVKEISRALEFHAATGSMGIKDSTMDSIFEIMAKNEGLDPNSKEFIKNEREIYSLIANDISHGKSFRDKVDSWRYMSMLSSPATHLRNISGNISMRGVAGAKNTLAAMIEAGADRVSKNGIDRTKSVITHKDMDLVNAARKDATEHAYRELSGNRYLGMKRGIEENMKVFNDDKKLGKVLNKLNAGISDSLSFEDELTKIDTYSTALSGYLKANGFDASLLDPEKALSADNIAKLKKVYGKGNRAKDFLTTNPDQMLTRFMDDARAYAINQAKIQTFNNMNDTASKLSQFTKGLRDSDKGSSKFIGTAIDIAIPFKNVPANVLNTVMAYSPAEFIKVASEVRKLKRGAIDAATFIDDVSKGLTGTMGLGIGALMAANGMIKLSNGKGTHEKNFDKATDAMNDSITIGGKSMKITQLIPSAAPLIFGATVYETLANKTDEASALTTMANGLGAITDGVVDMTMLQGISDILDNVKYSEDGASKALSLAVGIGGNAAGQFVPTIGGLLERGIDDTARNTYYTDQKGVEGDLIKIGKYNLTKLPFAQEIGEVAEKSDNNTIQTLGDVITNEPRIDVKGNEVKQKGASGLDRLLRGTFPFELGNDRSTDVDNKLRELAYSFPAGDSRDNVFPYASSKEAEFKNEAGENVVLNEKQWTEYQKAKGQMTDEMIETFLNSPEYEQLDNASRAEVLNDLYKFAKKYNQHVIGNGKIENTMAELAETYEKDGIEPIVKNYALNYLSENQQKELISQLPDEEKADAYKSLYGDNKTAVERYDRVMDILGPDALEPALDYYNEAATISNNKNGQVSGTDIAITLNEQEELSETDKSKYYQALTGKDEYNDKIESISGTTSEKKTTTEKQTTPTNPNSNLNPRSNMKLRDTAKKAKTQQIGSEVDELPDAETNVDSNGLNWQLSNGYDLKNTKTYQRAKDAGVSDAEFNAAWFAADADGNGYMKKAEAQNYVNTLPEGSRNTWFNILYKGR